MPLDMFGWTRRRGERLRYLRHLPWRQRLWLLAAVACTFSTLGFVTDLARLSEVRAPWTVIVSALASGLVACAYLLVGLSGLRWLPVAVLGQVVLVWAVSRMYAPPEVAVPDAATLERMAARARFDALALLGAVVAGYALFISFISRLGLRQVRLDTEIALAQDIHAHLVPPISRSGNGLEIAGRSLPSSEVGGDLLDVVERDGETLAIVADVSGHGVQAGTLMAMVRSAVRVRAAASLDLAPLIDVLDRVLVELDRPDKFVTAAALRFGPDGQAEAILAGHLPILIVRARGGAVERVENRRPPLGLPHPAAVERLRYETGDLFAIVTDGLTEVADRRGAHLGLDAIERVLRERAGDPLAEIADAVFGCARRHGAIDDDQTLLLVRAR